MRTLWTGKMVIHSSSTLKFVWNGCLKLVLEFGQFSDLLVTEKLFVDILDVLPPMLLAWLHLFTKWAGMFVIYAMGYQMLSHLAQRLPPFATAHTDVPIIHFHDNAVIDELLWKPKRSMNTCKYEDIEPNRKTRSSSTLTNRFHFNLDPAYSCLFNQHCIKHW